MRPTLFPQFTINAGLLTLAGIICFIAYGRTGGAGVLIAATLLAFMGYIVRKNEFYLVVGIALPLLPWGAILKNRQFKIALVILITTIAAAAVYDNYSYRGDEWKKFQEFESARVPYTDYGACAQMIKHPDIGKCHNFSVNDIILLWCFFVVDPKIADPPSLKAMLSDLGPMPLLEGSIWNGLNSIKALFSLTLLPIFLPALLIGLMRPGILLALSWALFFTALFWMGLSGRGSIFRVYIPILTFQYLISLINLYMPFRGYGSANNGRFFWRRRIALGIGISAIILNFSVLLPETMKAAENIKKGQEWITGLPDEPIVDWGGALPTEDIFPVFATNVGARELRILSLGVSTHTPFSVAHIEESQGRGFINRIRSPEGLLVMAYPYYLKLLNTWCEERFEGKLHVVPIDNKPILFIFDFPIKLSRVRCLER